MHISTCIRCILDEYLAHHHMMTLRCIVSPDDKVLNIKARSGWMGIITDPFICHSVSLISVYSSVWTGKRIWTRSVTVAGGNASEQLIVESRVLDAQITSAEKKKKLNEWNVVLVFDKWLPFLGKVLFLILAIIEIGCSTKCFLMLIWSVPCWFAFCFVVFYSESDRMQIKRCCSFVVFRSVIIIPL